MPACVINKERPEYKSLVEKSGLPEEIITARCNAFYSKHDRFPHLDEVLDANSEEYLRKNFKINKHNAVNIDEILDKTGKGSIEEAIIDLNNQHRDLDINITPIVKEAIVDIEHRPTVNNLDTHPVEVDSNPDKVQIMNNALVKLASRNGIQFKTLTDSDLTNFPAEVQSAKAFVYNGDIYINIDRADVDAPLHEMMHLFIGSMRFTEPKLYQSIIETTQLLPQFEKLASRYPNRSMNDVSEEIFVSEVANYVTGRESIINDLDPTVQYEIGYNIKRVMDTVLMGQDSVKTVSDGRLYNMTFKEIAKEVGSSIMTNNFRGFVNAEDSALHRKLNNMKSDLFKNKTLEEVCE